MEGIVYIIYIINNKIENTLHLSPEEKRRVLKLRNNQKNKNLTI